jgi:hypothetical protein
MVTQACLDIKQDAISKITNAKKKREGKGKGRGGVGEGEGEGNAGGMAQVVECLPSKHRALSSNPSTVEKILHTFSMMSCSSQ